MLSLSSERLRSLQHPFLRPQVSADQDERGQIFVHFRLENLIAERLPNENEDLAMLIAHEVTEVNGALAEVPEGDLLQAMPAVQICKRCIREQAPVSVDFRRSALRHKLEHVFTNDHWG